MLKKHNLIAISRRVMISLIVLAMLSMFQPADRCQADQTTLTASGDNWLREDDAIKNYGTDDQLKTRPGSQRNHAIVQFDVSSIPSCAKIASATFGIYEETIRDDTQTITVYRLTESWTELGSSWTKRDGTTDWATPGGTYDATSLGSFQPTSTGWKTFDVTTVVQNWVNGTYGSNGFVLVPTTTSSTGDVRYTSREGAEAQRPYLDITYNLNSNPTVDAVGIYETNHTTAVTAMTPQTEYAVKVTVTDGDTLDDLSTVKVTIFYDTDGDNDPADVPGTGDTQNAAILTCTVAATPTWGIDPSASTTWSIETANCVQPTLTNTTGDWWFHFKPGKVATEALDWDAYAVADDGCGTPGTLYDSSGYDMNWYGEITVNTPGINFGTVDLGSDFSVNSVTNISVTYIANGGYNQQVKALNPWTSGSYQAGLEPSGNPGDGEFSLKANDTATLAEAVLVLSTGYTTFDTGTQTGESGNVETTNTLWLKLGATGILDVTYSGTIYYQIAQ